MKKFYSRMIAVCCLMTVFTGALQARCWTDDSVNYYSSNTGKSVLSSGLNKTGDNEGSLTCDADIGQLSIHNLGNNTNAALVNGGSYLLSSLPGSWNVEAQVSGSSAESVKFTFSGSYSGSNIENSNPYRSPGDNTPLNLGIGTYTLNVKLYSSDNAGGNLCDQKTITFSITGPECNLSVDAGPPQQVCAPAQLTLNASVTGAASCEIPGSSDCNHQIVASGGYIGDLATAGICTDNAGAKLWTLGNQGTSFITLDFGANVPVGTQICVRMKLEHCTSANFSNANAKIQSSLDNSSFSDIASAVSFSQTSYQDFCYTLTSPARYIKVLDNGQCAFRLDYVKYTIPPSSGGSITYLWSGPGIVGPSDEVSVVVNQSGTYIITVTDCAGCVATDTVVVTSDGIPPVFNDQQSQYTLDCGENIPLIQPVATDNNGSVSYSFLDTQTCTQPDAYCSCTHIRVWTATDLCGNTASFTQSFTYSDTIDPVLHNVPENFSAQCGQIPSPGIVSATDNCDDNVDIEYSEEVIGENCPVTLVRTWTATDDCGNSVSASQSILINDSSNPELIGVPENATVECDDVPAPALVTAEDNCAFDLSVQYSQDSISNECGYILIRHWSVVDYCGNSASASQQLTVTDTTDPVLHGVPSDISAECSDIPEPAVVTATDNCDSSVDVVYSQSGSVEGCNASLVRTWTATDACGNTVSASQIITVGDHTDPVLHGVPSNTSAECSAIPEPAVVTATDNCDEFVEVAYSQTGSTVGCDAALIRTWTATDACGNTVSASQTITVGDTTDPVLHGVPSDLSVDCSDEVPEVAVVSATDNCDENVTIEYNESSDDISCGYVLARTWTATDDCGNSASATQFITVSDDVAPVVANEPEDLIVECGEEIPAYVPVWSDNCDNDLEESAISGTGFEGCNQLIFTSWIAIDDCGNQSTVSRTVTIVDTTDPVATYVPADVTFECDEDVVYEEPSFTDNCDEELTVEPASSISGDECLRIIHRSWTATDNCGNSITVVQNITIQDTTAPYVVDGGDDASVDCGEGGEIPTITIADNCDENPSFTYTDGNYEENGCGESFDRTYLLVDDCGNESTFIQHVVVGDDTPPVIHGVGEDITVQCIDEVPAISDDVWADDNCDEDVQLLTFGSETGDLIAECVATSAFGPGADWSFWVPELASGGISSSANFHFDNNGGSFDQFADGTAHLYGTVVNDLNPNEQFLINVWFENGVDWATWSGLGRWYKDDLNCATPGQLYQNWTYYEMVNDLSVAIGTGDLAGVVLQLQHMPANYFFGFQVGQGANNKNCNYGASGWFTYTGFSDCEPISGHGDFNNDLLCDPVFENECDNTSFTYIYQAIDDAGNITIVTQVITVQDTIAPEFVDCPEELWVSCESEVPGIPNPTAVDNCEGDVVIVFLGETIEGNVPCDYLITRTWYAEDLCGNRSYCISLIHVHDDIAPVFSFVPEDITVECSDEVPFVWATATDNCSVPAVTYEDIFHEDECYGIIERVFTAVDSCGNVSQATQWINIEDTTAPVFDPYEIYLQVECEQADNIGILVSATDNCSEVEITYTEIFNSGGCLGVFERIYTATDACGNISTAIQYISIQDTTPPVIVAPDDFVAQCSDDLSIPELEATDNCGYEVTVDSWSEIVEIDSCVYQLIWHWTATDYCENVSEDSTVVTVVDTTDPIFVFVPADYTAECSDELALDAAFATDNCSDPVVTVSESEVAGDCPYNYQIIRTFTATDACGNTATAQQVITVVDTTAPVIEGQSQLTVECDEELPLVTPSASDNCGEVTLNFSDSLSFESPCYSLVIRTWTATDECGNSSTFDQFINIVDTTAPVFDAYTVEIDRPCDDYNGIYVTATDNCNNFDITFSDEAVSGGCAGRVIRTYYAEDICGNVDSIQQIITLIDTVAPVAEFVPENFTIECGTQYILDNAIFSDNCDNDLIITTDQSESVEDCIYTVIYSWTATDHCANATTVSTVVTIVDTTAPWFGETPADTTVSCQDALPEVVLPSAFDLCDDSVDVEFTDVLLPGNCPQSYTIQRIFRAYDDCGNSVLAVQNIFVVDTLAPVIEGQSQLTVECDEELPLVTPSASDNCGEVTLNFSDSLSFESPCYSIVIRTWTATDECGNSSTFVQFINIVDTTAPVFDAYTVEIDRPCDDFNGIYVTATDNCNNFEITFSDEVVSGACAGRVIRTYYAEDICGNVDSVQQIITLIDTVAPVAEFVQENFTVECDQEYSVPDAIFSDNCDDELIIVPSQSEEQFGCIRVITYTWTATDHCANETIASTVVTIVDTTDPVFVFVPADYTAECSDELALDAAFAIDNCSEAVVTVSESEVAGDCPQNYQLIRTFTATDACGNTATAQQVITVVDTTAPSVEGQSQLTAECDEELPLVTPSASDNCGEVTLNFSDSVSFESPCYSLVIRTWTATDECGNSSTFDQFINIVDTTAPVFDAYTVEINRPCDDYNGIYVTATDNCNNFEITSSDEIVSGACAGRVIRTYYATDICGNIDSVQQIITLIDTVAPVAEFVQENFTVECDQEYSVPDAIFSDNCDNDLIVVPSQSEEQFGCIRVITYTWTATDHCANETAVSTVVTIVDTTDPVFVFVPADYTAECSDELDLDAAFAIDNCSEAVVTVSESEVAGDCPQNYQLIRTFTATDACGNTATAQQVITVVDTTAPSVEGQSQLTVECDEELPLVTPSASDNCGEVTLNFSDSVSFESPCYSLVIRTWTATDECGNSSTFDQFINIVDTTAPVFDAYITEIDRPCDDYNGIYVTATDNCNNFEITSSDEIVSGACAGRVIRTYYATDICGNVDSVQQIITLIDVTAPVVAVEPEDLILACGEEVPSYEPEWSDNCDNDLQLSAISATAFEGCNQIISTVWTAVDHCGNSTSVSRTVTFIDTIAPEFVFVPESFTANCDEALEPGDAFAVDNCDEDVEITVEEEQVGEGCEYILVRTFTASDECGNTAVAVQTIAISDHTAPEFTFVPSGGLFSCDEFDAQEVAEAEDNCSEATVTHSDETGDIPADDAGAVLCGYRITRTWTAVDACGNSATAVTIYDIYDNEGPVFDQEVSNVTVECESEIPAFEELTATDACSEATVERTETVLQADTCGNQVILVSYVATDTCGNQSHTSYLITVDDQTAPVLSSLPENITLDCGDEIPAAAELTATDNCGGEVEVIFEELIFGENSPAEGSIADCQILTPVRPLGNPCGYPYDWAMAMFAMPNAHKYYQITNGQLIQYPNGTIHVIATMHNAANPANGFFVDVEFINGMDWATWSTQNFITGFKADCGGIAANHPQWIYYLLNNNNSTLTGFGGYAGSFFTLSHAPSNNFFGFQLGDGANNYNGANDGFGGWFTYSGMFFVDGQQVGNITSGAGDFAFELDCCADYQITRCWTAVDCSGNVTQYCQTITIGGDGGESPEIPQVSSSAPGKLNPQVNVYPNPLVDQTTFAVTALETGRIVLDIFDLAGAKVSSVMNTRVEAGQEYKMTFDAGNLATGIYMYQMVNGSHSEMGRIVVNK